MTTDTISQTRSASRASGRLTGSAGWAILSIAVLHTAVFIPQASWSDWFDGSLRAFQGDPDSLAVFWALPGGFVLPGAMLGLFLIRMGRQRMRVGLGYALTLAVWASFCLWLVGPSGFMLFYVPAGLLLAASIVNGRTPGRG